MTFSERPGVWRTAFAKTDVEINLGGDASGASPANTEMAAACEAQLAAVLSKALAYISEHIGRAAGVSGQPEIEWIDFGLSNYGEHREFELYFSDEATYVLWAVRFQFHSDTETRAASFSPVGFSRRSW